MPSGSITTTPGATITTSTSLTHTVLNNLGLPTMRVDEDAVGVRELRDLNDVVEAVGEQAIARNGFSNPMLDRHLIRSTAAVSSAAGAHTQVAPGWFVSPAGAAVTQQHGAFSVTGATPAAAMILTGATSVTTVDYYQYVPPYYAQRLAAGTDITVTFCIQNNTGASLTPLLRLDSSDTEGDRATVSNEVSEAADSAIANGAVGVRSWTVAVGDVTNFRNGFRLGLRFPSGALDGAGKSVRVGGAILVPGDTAGSWSAYRDVATLSNRAQRRHQMAGAADPTADNDSTEGYTVGSVWRTASSGDRFQCVRNIAGQALWVKLSPSTAKYGFFRHEATSGTAQGTNITAANFTEILDADSNWSVTSNRFANTAGRLYRVRAWGTSRPNNAIHSVEIDSATIGRFPYSFYSSNAYANNDATAALDSYALIWSGETHLDYYSVSGVSGIAYTLTSGVGSAPAASLGVEIYGFCEIEEIPVPALGNASVGYTGQLDAGSPVNRSNALICRLVIEENIVISVGGTWNLTSLTVQGVTLANGDYLLLIGQENPVENGAYRVNSGSLTANSAYNETGEQYAIAQITAGSGRGRTYLQRNAVTENGATLFLSGTQVWQMIECPMAYVD